MRLRLTVVTSADLRRVADQAALERLVASSSADASRDENRLDTCAGKHVTPGLMPLREAALGAGGALKPAAKCPFFEQTIRLVGVPASCLRTEPAKAPWFSASGVEDRLNSRMRKSLSDRSLALATASRLRSRKRPERRS
jgi:hypothetical protein